MAALTGGHKNTGDLHNASEYNDMYDAINALYAMLQGGQEDQVLAKASNTDHDFEWVTPGIAPNAKPVASNVVITGTAQEGQTLTRSYVYSDGDGDIEGTSITKWYRANNTSGAGEVVIGGATGGTYQPTGADVGKYIRSGVIPVAATGDTTGTETFSAYTSAVIAAAEEPETFDVRYGYSVTDPYINDSTAPTFIEMGTLTPTLGADISVPFHDMPTLTFSVVEYDATEDTKDTWFNTPFNYGTIPDSAQRAVFTVAGKKYIVARNAITYDPSPSNPVVFS